MAGVVGGGAIKEIALTNDIADEKRQALAYNMLRYMMDNGAEIKAGNRNIPSESKDQLWIVSKEDGGATYKKPSLDTEWYSANRDEFDKGKSFFTLHNECDDGTIVKVAPLTSSYEKANNMFNFMHWGIDNAISIAFPTDKGMKAVVKNGKPASYKNPRLRITNESGIKMDAWQHSPDWAETKWDDYKYVTEPVFTGKQKYEILKDDEKKVNSGSYSEYFESEMSKWEKKPDRTVYRIRALRDFGDVKKGDLGGYIESENNLSHDGNCWIYDNAMACCDAIVKDNATLRGNVKAMQAAVISGNANVFGEARVGDDACVTDHAMVGWEWDGTQNEQGWKNADRTIVENNAVVRGHAQVLGEVVVSENAKIQGNAVVEGKWPSVPKDKYKNYYISAVCDNAVIEGNARVTNTYARNNSHIHGDSVVSGHPTMGGHAEVKGNAEVCGNAKVMHNVQISGDATVGGTAEIKEKVSIGHDADIKGRGDYVSLKEIGKTSCAFRSKGGVTVVHKGKTYDMDDFEDYAEENLGEKELDAAMQVKSHFDSRKSIASYVSDTRNKPAEGLDESLLPPQPENGGSNYQFG